MICPECKEQGLKSTVHGGGAGMTTLKYCPPYYDEDGKFHSHDSNITTSNWSCSNGHRFTIKSSGSCWCGWGKDA